MQSHHISDEQLETQSDDRQQTLNDIQEQLNKLVSCKVDYQSKCYQLDLDNYQLKAINSKCIVEIELMASENAGLKAAYAELLIENVSLKELN